MHGHLKTALSKDQCQQLIDYGNQQVFSNSNNKQRYCKQGLENHRLLGYMIRG